MAANIIESFFVSLGFEVNTEKIEEFKKKTEELRESATTIGSLFTGAAAGIGLLVQGVAASMGDIASFAELNDVSARSVAALGKIAAENDGSLEGMKSTIQSLNKTIGEAAIGVGRGAMTFEKLGLQAKRADGSVKTVDDLLAEVADKMQGLSRQEQIAMAEKLGIDPQFVKVLEKGSANLAKLREEAELLNPFTEQDYQLADQVDKLFLKAKATLGTFTKMLGVSLLPTVKEVLQNYLEWFKASRKATSDVVIRGLQLISGLIGSIWDWVVRLVSGLKSAYDWLTQFKAAIYAAAAAVAVFIAYQIGTFFNNLWASIKLATAALRTFIATGAVAAAPLVLIGALAAAVALLIDSYVNWKEGNESFIGDMIKQFPWLLGVIQGLEEAVGALVDFWLTQFNTLKGPLSDLGASIWKLVSTLAELLWPVVKMIFTGWAYIMAAVIPIVASLIGWIAEALVGAIVAVIEAGTWLANAFTAVFNGIKAGIDFVVEVFETAKQKVMGFIDMVMGAIGKVGQLLGLTDDASKVKVAVSSGGGAQASANNSLNAAGGVIGSAGSNTSNTSTVTQTTQITGTTIQINSPDPAKAGEAVEKKLEQMNRQATRNGQTAVAL